MVRSLPLLIYLAVAFLFGISLGERGELGVVQHVFTGVIPIATAIMAWLSRGARVDVMLTGAAILIGLILGQRSFEKAFAECVRDGESVHAALVAYNAQHDGYPSRLEELDVDLPCDCILRDTILHYLSNERAFRLWISNDSSTVNFTASGKSAGR
ncbi:MAG TPA: hypothetical protein VEU30_11745 [Thermoanaerobaculia bacterium]|nr:hypothetical protein [Thermoanaerobaculia bacterium]